MTKFFKKISGSALGLTILISYSGQATKSVSGPTSSPSTYKKLPEQIKELDTKIQKEKKVIDSINAKINKIKEQLAPLINAFPKYDQYASVDIFGNLRPTLRADSLSPKKFGILREILPLRRNLDPLETQISKENEYLKKLTNQRNKLQKKS